MYIVSKGAVEEIYINNKTGNVIPIKKKEVTIKKHFILKNLKSGSIFGWHSFMTEDKRKVTVRSKNFSQIYELKREDFLKIITTNVKDYVK